MVGLRGDDTFAGVAGLLKPGNSYARAAGALILVCANEGPDDKTALYSAVDAGAALANLSIEAVSQSLHAHPMAGFDVAGARAVFGIPDEFRPLFVVAVGSLAEPAGVSDEIAERDALPRYRLPLEDIAFARAWGQSYLGEF
jgi:nitroreductase